MVVFISGPISGVDDYKQKFAEVEDKLTKLGNIVLNPTSINPNLPYEDLMRICFKMIDIADVVYFMTGWASSKGAMREYYYASAHQKPIREG